MGLKKKLDPGIQAGFKAIKQELDEHREAINSNTNEFGAIYDLLEEYDKRIEKLNERVDELQMHVIPQKELENEIKLTHREQEVFLVLYTVEESVSAKSIAKILGFSDEMVHTYVYNLISKGVPVKKKFVKEKTMLYLDGRFKSLQAKKNLVKIDEGISQELIKEKII